MQHLPFRDIFAATPNAYLLLAAEPNFTIVDVNAAYLCATMTARERLVGMGLFEAFPDNPGDPLASGVRNLRASLERVMEHRRSDRMAVQKYDIRSLDGSFEERYWSPHNVPVLDAEGRRVQYIIHHVQDVTELVRLRSAASSVGPDTSCGWSRPPRVCSSSNGVLKPSRRCAKARSNFARS